LFDSSRNKIYIFFLTEGVLQTRCSNLKTNQDRTFTSCVLWPLKKSRRLMHVEVEDKNHSLALSCSSTSLSPPLDEMHSPHSVWARTPTHKHKPARILGVRCEQAGRPETPLLTNLRSKRKGRGGTWADIVLQPASQQSLTMPITGPPSSRKQIVLASLPLRGPDRPATASAYHDGTPRHWHQCGRQDTERHAHTTSGTGGGQQGALASGTTTKAA